ncbi:alpha-L-rhamnosidase [Sediminihabitans luteus]|uniref:alpha-L-rhamnosidase n=1 Tax=Sediminihabitans luteus TaxID=1138585 RepID=A0A2M9CD25_9CELL|nr:family 78 glycoside hydrolase catalytic domain [Sediminihabitans luteus]PJJ69201.1 alpha-L-rhamnosidase [Sediminihabitans luteus]GII98876.1 alpha-L-rhamnosidase [Sediminihabitans luteus]
MPGAVDLRVEHRPDGLGVGDRSPRLSWRLEGLPHGVEQVAHEIEVARDGDETSRTTGHGSGTSLVDWPGAPLRSRERSHVRVRSTLSDGTTTPWTPPLVVEAGLDPQDWAEPFVSPSTEASADGPRPAHLLRARLDVPAWAVRVRAYVTAHGVHELEVDGERLGDDELAPGWSSFEHRLRYRTIDLDDVVRPGTGSVLGVWLADGWYRGRLGFNGGLWDVYGRDVAVLVQVEAHRADGRVERLPLEWRTAPAPVVATGLYEGETHDARLEQPGWSLPGFDDSAWEVPTTLPRELFTHALEEPPGPPVRVTEVLRPVAVERRPDGRVRLDFGQNVSGRLRVSAAAPRGHVLRLHHAEVLEGDALGVRPLRSATSVDTYVFAGTGEETWTPRFTLHGFRYAELEGWPDGADPSTVEALVVHSAMTRTGWFASSDPLLDRFHENVVWSMRDNFVDLPTDCPQRDERLGWTGDIQVFAPAAAFLHDSTGVLLSWLRDLGAEQRAQGTVRNFHPWLECGFPAEPAAAWGDAAVIVPWTLYERTGDLRILRDHVASMAAWVDQVDALTGGTGLWDSGFQLGDWLDPAAPPTRPGDSATDAHLVATAYHARSAALVARTYELLDEPAQADRCAAIADRARAAFRSTFVSPAGRVVSDTVTALSVAICFDLLDERQLAVAGARLVEKVVESDHRISTGFVGTPLVCDALARTGSPDTAYHLLLQTACPSWLYPVTMGATTVWERWDSMLPDGTINPGEMTSFNHYALGAVVDHLHRVVGGLAPAAPGYRHVLFAPVPGGGLTHASAEHLSPQGMVRSAWRREGDVLHLTVEVPPGARGTVRLPDGSAPVEVGPGTSTHACRVRPAVDDPVAPRRWNVHDPQERQQMIREGVAS